MIKSLLMNLGWLMKNEQGRTRQQKNMLFIQQCINLLSHTVGAKYHQTIRNYNKKANLLFQKEKTDRSSNSNDTAKNLY